MYRSNRPFSKNLSRALRLWAAAVCCLAWMLFPSSAAAQPLIQSPLEPGEAVTVDLLQGEEITYAFDISDVGRFRLQPALLPAAGAVQVSLVRTAVLYKGPVVPIDLTLTPGPYTLRFQADEDAVFDFVLVRHGGAWADNPDAPQAVGPGHFVAGRGPDAQSHYLRLRVPAQTEPREWFLQLGVVKTGPWAATLIGEENTVRQFGAEDGALSFWSDGGDYLLHLALEDAGAPAEVAFYPALETSITPLYLNSEFSGELAPQRRRMLFQAHASQAFLATLRLESDYTGDLDLKIQSLSAPQQFAQRSASPLASENIASLLLPAGSYLISVDRVSGEGSAEFSLAFEADPIRTLPATPGIVTVEYQGEDELLNLHVFDVPRAGQLVEILLEPWSASRPAFVFGRQRRDWMELPQDRVAFVSSAAGPHYVGVRTLYGYGRYDLRIDTERAAPLLAGRGIHAGSIDPATRQDFRLRVPPGSALTSIILISLSDQDLDLETAGYDAALHRLEHKVSAADPKVESVAWFDPAPRYLLVSVLSFGSEPTEFLLITHSQSVAAGISDDSLDNVQTSR